MKTVKGSSGTFFKRYAASWARKVLIGVKTTAPSQPEGEVDKYLFSFNYQRVFISSVSNKSNALYF